MKTRPEHAYVDTAIHSFAVARLYINVKYVYRGIDCRPRRAYSCWRPEHGREHDIVNLPNVSSFLVLHVDDGNTYLSLTHICILQHLYRS